MSEEKKQTNLVPILLIAAVILVSAIIWATKKPKTCGFALHNQHTTTLDYEHDHTHEKAAEIAKNADSDTPQKLNLNDVIRNARSWEPTYQKWYGKKAPDFTIADINGKTHKLSDYYGKDVMIVFWATWCQPCITEIPHLIALRNLISDEKLAILAISNERKETVQNFLKSQKINYTVLTSDSRALPSPYNSVNSIPTSFFIDSEGKIKLATSGMTSLGDIRAILRAER